MACMGSGSRWGALVLWRTHIVRHLAVVAQEVDRALRMHIRQLHRGFPNGHEVYSLQPLILSTRHWLWLHSVSQLCCQRELFLKTSQLMRPTSQNPSPGAQGTRADACRGGASGGASAERAHHQNGRTARVSECQRGSGQTGQGAHVIVRVPGDAVVCALRGGVGRKGRARHGEPLLVDDACAPRHTSAAARRTRGHAMLAVAVCLVEPLIVPGVLSEKCTSCTCLGRDRSGCQYT